MEKSSVEKLLKAGYIFLRKDYGYASATLSDRGNEKSTPKIKYSDSFGVWRTFQKFATKAARDRRLQELLQEDKYIM